MPNWTEQQKDAIQDRGHSLIVCAAAGSGKTAVLVERIVQLVREGCPIDKMLVVTFTNAAAGEMRLRIGEALSKAARTDPALGAQMMALSRASISTLHRFCGNLLREQFQALGIDPSFRIGDEQECGVLRRQAMEDALYSCYEVGTEAFLAADACYEQEELAELADRIDRFMMTRPDPQMFLSKAQKMISEEGVQAAARLLMEDVSQQLMQLKEDAEGTLSLCRMPDGPMHYEAACAEDVVLLADLVSAADKGYAALSGALQELSYASLGRRKKTDLFDENIADRVKARRESLKKTLNGMAETFGQSWEQAVEDAGKTGEPLAGIIELVKTFEMLYQAAKRQRGVLDFDDLEHGALKALEDPAVREALRARYRYVFIDEYQDSSAIQEAVIGSFAREDGLFLVGDVKQSIYRFRQAEPTIFLERAARFDREEEPLARRIDLQKNFRSRANVLEAVNAVFVRIMRGDVTEIEYDERERLVPGLPEREDDPPAELHLLYKPEEDEESDLAAVEQEALVAAERIRELAGMPFYDAKIGAERPLRYRDMAILMRAAKGGAPLAAEILKAEGIPVFCDAGEGYFDIPEVHAMMALLSAIENGAQDEALLAALRGPALGLEDSELARIRIFTPDTRIPYHEAVRRYREEAGDELAGKLKVFEEKRLRWRLCARHQGVDRLIERIYAETGFLAEAGALPGGAARQANLHLLTTRARAFMSAQGGSLHAFLRYAQRLKAGGDSMSASAIGENEDVVRLMTTHKSKGLEFPVVIVLNMGRKMSEKSLHDRVLLDAELGIGLPCIDTALGSERDTLQRRAIRIKTRREQLAEEVRILYVAMTRARERLILVGSVGGTEPLERWRRGTQKNALRDMHTGLDMVAPAMMEAGASLTIREEKIELDNSCWHIFAHTAGAGSMLQRRSDETTQRLLAQLAAAKDDPDMETMMAFETSGRAGVRKTSVSAFLRDEKRAADDELHQHDVEVERMPRFMMEKMMTGAQIGTAFHRIMCMLDLNALRQTTSLEKEIERQLADMLQNGIITQQEIKAVPVYRLTDFFAQPLGVRMLASNRVEREWAFTYRREMEGGVQLLQGVVDCCFIENGRWVLVDYKTDSDVQGAIGRHRGQLEIYAEALERLTGIPVADRTLYLVRAGRGYSI